MIILELVIVGVRLKTVSIDKTTLYKKVLFLAIVLKFEFVMVMPY